MAIHNRAGQPAQQRDLINVAQLTAQYYKAKPQAGNSDHAVKFGTSGHRGSAARHSFNELHILAIAQAIAEERAKNGVTGPGYVGADGRMRFLNRLLSRFWKCWRPTAWMIVHAENKRLHPNAGDFKRHSGITVRAETGGWDCDYAVRRRRLTPATFPKFTKSSNTSPRKTSVSARPGLCLGRDPDRLPGHHLS